MQSFETSATVQQPGVLHVSGVPFTVGTEVEIAITIDKEVEGSAKDARSRAARLFAALDKSHNSESVGPLRREEIYDDFQGQ